MKHELWKYGLFLIFAMTLVASSFSFNQEPKAGIENEDLIPPLVQKELEKKIKRYQNTILEKCRKKAMEAAETYIDSLVSEELKFQSSDTLVFPAKPIRPNLREPIILNDSTDISPIIK